MRAPKTRSPKFSSRISIASLAWSVLESTMVGRMPAMSTSGFRFSRIMDRVFWSWISPRIDRYSRSEEHTSELQSRLHLVCRLLLEKKKKKKKINTNIHKKTYKQ